MNPPDWFSHNARALWYGILGADPGTREGRRKMAFYAEALREVVDLVFESAGHLERCRTSLPDSIVAQDCLEAARQGGFPMMNRDGLD